MNNTWSANPSETLKNLAKYYRDLLSTISAQAGKHFIDLNGVLRYGLTADLGLFVQDIEELINGDSISFIIQKAAPSAVTKIIQRANDIEESEEQAQQAYLFEDNETILEEQEKQNASAILVAIYRKQQFDPFNREIVIGYPLVSGKLGRKRICTALFYNKVLMDFNPLQSLVTLTKDSQIPSLNFQLIKHIVESDEEVEIIRQDILPDLRRDDFDLDTIKNVIQKLSQLIPGFGGLAYQANSVSLRNALELSGKAGIKILNTSMITNARRTNAHLLDDLEKLAKIDDLKGDSVVNTFLTEPLDEDSPEDMDDPAISEKKPPLLFPLQSNKMQRLAAVKAENARLFVIQGPPGTGKSQTIVNLVCHLIAQGKTVLVSSHQNKALEVITKSMPRKDNKKEIDYLVMSLLKGEKESIKELTNKIDGFQSYVSQVDVKECSNRIELLMAELQEKDRLIKQLQVRFSELKIIERDKHPHYHKYHDIRNYDFIDPSDSIPDGMDSIIANALSEYSSLLKGLTENESYHYIQKILPSYDPAFVDDGGDYLLIKCETCSIKNRVPKTKLECDAKCGHCGGEIRVAPYNIEDSIENIRQLIKAHDWITRVVLSDEDVLVFCKGLADINAAGKAIVACLERISQWAGKSGHEMIGALQFLNECRDIDIDFDLLKKKVREYGHAINEIERRIEGLTEQVQSLGEYDIVISFPDYPDIHTLQNAKIHLNELHAAAHSWWKWHFSLKAGSARKFLKSLLCPSLTYQNRSELLKKMAAWQNHWNLRYQIIVDLNWLNEMDVLVERTDHNSPLGEIYKKANTISYYGRVITALHALLLCSYDIKEESIDEQICSYLVSNNLSILLKCLAQSGEYLKLKASLQARKSDNHFAYLCDFLFPTVVETISNLTPIPGNDKIVTHVNTIMPHFYDFKRLKTLESSYFKTLSKTSDKIKNLILTGQDVAALAKPELVVEAFRLAAFMRKDLIENPDDINEIALKIGHLKKESRRLILRILDTIRRKSLKKAESNTNTRHQIRNLAEILKRKRKTYSFVQLKEQIEYESLLKVFPCWIMSIEDAARIFPLQEGLFDYLIVDEASQCNQATALHLAYRAKRMIVVGDSKQMKNPNTQFLSDHVVRLNLTKYGLDKHPKAEFFHGKKSLLDLAGGCSDRSDVFLDEHFRCEPPLIAFSNEKFYQKLKVLTPFRRRRFSPCMEIRTINGAYDDPDNTKQNEIEAAAVIAELKRMIAQGELEGDEKGEKLSVGLLSLFRHQATLLQSKMYDAFEDDPSKINEYDMIASTVDGFQGDERDVILYSFRYAPNSKPGSITAMQKENDEHSLGRINVAFSRPKRKSVCFISRPKEQFPKGLIRDYLNHAANENNRPYERLGNPNEREKCQSDFEKHVFDDLVKEGLDVFGQVPCAGFFIDFVVIDRDGRRMAVECDGDFHYEEDGDLREEDYQRQDIIERYGWFVYRIPVRRYYADPRKTIEHLLSTLRQQNPDEEIGGGFNGQNGGGSKGPSGYTEPSESYEDIITTESIEDKIIDLLSQEGPMTTWMIAGKIRLPREETHVIMKTLEEKEWVIAIKEKGVMMWKEIL